MLAKGYDQGIHIWLLYNEFLKQTTATAVRVLQYDDVYISGAAGMRLNRDVRLQGGVVVNMRNSTIAVVHQYNRMQYVVKDTLGCRAPRGAAEPDYCLECRRNWNASGAVGKGATKWIRWQGSRRV